MTGATGSNARLTPGHRDQAVIGIATGATEMGLSHIGETSQLPKRVSRKPIDYEALPGSASNAAAMRSVNGPSLPLGNASRAVGAVTASVVPVSG
jgi:hypothetical protein